MFVSQRGVIPPVQLVELASEVYERGSFTLTGNTGWAAPPSGTVQYQKWGALVSLWSTAQISAVSNATNMIWEGVPASLRPTTSAATGVCRWVDNGVTTLFGSGAVSTSGLIVATAWETGVVANRITDNSAAPFTAAGNKGLPSNWVLSYLIN